MLYHLTDHGMRGAGADAAPMSEQAGGQFDYQWSVDITPKHIESALNQVGDADLRIQWMSGGGATIERSVSISGLERWKIESGSDEQIDLISATLSSRLAPLAIEDASAFGTLRYQQYGWPEFVGWLFWHREEA